MDENKAELVRRVEALLGQAAADGLLAGDDMDSNAIATKWVLVLETAASDSRWLQRYSSPGAFVWEWEGMMHAALKHG